MGNHLKNTDTQQPKQNQFTGRGGINVYNAGVIHCDYIPNNANSISIQHTNQHLNASAIVNQHVDSTNMSIQHTNQHVSASLNVNQHVSPTHQPTRQ